MSYSQLLPKELVLVLQLLDLFAFDVLGDVILNHLDSVSEAQTVIGLRAVVICW
jgi:hypothetical protein